MIKKMKVVAFDTLRISQVLVDLNGMKGTSLVTDNAINQDLDARAISLYLIDHQQDKDDNWFIPAGGKYIDYDQGLRVSVTNDLDYWQLRKDYDLIRGSTDEYLPGLV